MKKTSGFSLTELMVVVSIIGALAAISIPSYQSYMKKTHFTEITQASAPYKLGVNLCFQKTANLTDCNAGIHGIPKAINSGEHPGLIDSLSVNQGVISITPKAKNGISATDTYILTPSIVSHHLSWSTQGGAVENGLAG